MRISVLAVLVVAPGITTAVLDQNAWPLVKRAIESDAKTTYTCIREWTSWGGKETVQVRRDQASSGANRVFVLSPIHQQGFTIVDNARQRLTYNPDKGELTIQDSPLKVLSANDSSRRFRLLERNYKVEREAAESVAGRNAIRVRLQPIAKEF